MLRRAVIGAVAALVAALVSFVPMAPAAADPSGPEGLLGWLHGTATPDCDQTTGSAPCRPERAAGSGSASTWAPQAGSGRTTPEPLPAIDGARSQARQVRVRLEIEQGARVDRREAARAVAQTLGAQRGWQREHGVRFVPSRSWSETDLTIIIASPTLTDRLCAPLRTGGRYSCRAGDRVVLNSRRWKAGSQHYGEDLVGYRRYLVNHEVGHYLGYGHVGCPAPGRSAPTMLQQSKGLGGCRPNPWPSIA